MDACDHCREFEARRRGRKRWLRQAGLLPVNPREPDEIEKLLTIVTDQAREKLALVKKIDILIAARAPSRFFDK